MSVILEKGVNEPYLVRSLLSLLTEIARASIEGQRQLVADGVLDLAYATMDCYSHPIIFADHLADCCFLVTVLSRDTEMQRVVLERKGIAKVLACMKHNPTHIRLQRCCAQALLKLATLEAVAQPKLRSLNAITVLYESFLANCE